MNDLFDGFSINLHLDEEGDWLAHFEELAQISAYSSVDVEDALRELQIAWEAYKTSCRQHGDPVPVAPALKSYSGQFNVRIDKRIHRALAIEAAQAGISLNALVAQKLARTTHTDL